ncbi:MAG: hypothetical protein WCH39_18145 [Schlesneria sp.]
MSFDWQYVAVVGCVIWAVAVLIMRGYRLFRQPSSTSCGSGVCHGCPSNTTQQTSGLIQLNAPTQVDIRHNHQ